MNGQDTRALILAYWRGARDVADQTGALHGSAPMVAGQYLDFADGDVDRALALLPRGGTFWARARSILTEIQEHERAAAAQARALSAGGIRR